MASFSFHFGRVGRILGPAFGICAIAYFAFHAIEGDRGVIALRDAQIAIDVKKQQAAALRSERERLEHRVKLLHPKSLDRDMLDERARTMLNLGQTQETVILLPRDAE